MHSKPRKRRVPQLKFTEQRGIGWHVSYRDPVSGTPRKQRFEAGSQGEAERQYHEWVTAFLDGKLPEKKSRVSRRAASAESDPQPTAEMVPGCLLQVASSLLKYEESRVRPEGERRSAGTITRDLFERRKRHLRDFLGYLNDRHGTGAVASMQLADLSMADIEAYNLSLVEASYSQSEISKRMRYLKTMIDRAGRPEHGTQLLGWNWDSRDNLHGKPAVSRTLPTLKQLKEILKASDSREQAMIWLAIGCGFGQRDLSVVRVGQFDRKNYDLRRGKTGIERFGLTPPLVWKSITAYLETTKRKNGDLLFLTRKSMPLVHDNTDSVAQWWGRLRQSLGETGKGLGGFYTLRHLGATEFGSRPGCSIGAMRGWLGHSASSQMADVYMRPVSPESKPIVEWVRRSLENGVAR